MGYGRALLQRDVKQEEADLQKKATKKSLWSSIGRTAGSLAVMGLTGGAVNPLTLALITGAATAAGGAAGAKLSNTGDLSKGKFFKSDREAIQKELGAFGTQNLMSALKSGLTAGITQKLNLMKSGKEAAKLSEGFGLDFEGSMVGRGVEKVKHGGTDVLHKMKQGKADLLYGGDKTAASKEIAEGLKSYKFGSGVEGRAEPWQESLFSGVDPNPSSILQDKEVVQGIHDGWQPKQTMGSGSNRGFSFGNTSQNSSSNKRWW